MGRVSTYRNRMRMPIMPAGGRGGRMAISAMTAEQRAIGEFAGAAGALVTGLGRMAVRDAREDRIEADNISAFNAQLAIDTYIHDEKKALGEREFVEIEDFDKTNREFSKGLDAYFKTLLTDKNEDVKRAIQTYYDGNKIRNLDSFSNELDNYKVRFAQTKFFENQQRIRTQTTTENAEQQKFAMLGNIDAYKDFFTPSQINSLKGAVEADISNAIKQNFLEEVAVSTREMPIKDALSYINKIPRTVITETDRNGLVAQRKRQEEIETATTNRKVRWDVLRKVTENPQSVTDEWLESLVKPDSLTWDDAEEFKKIRDDANEPLKTPRAQLYFNSLDALFVERETDKEQRVSYDIANEKLVQFFETTPNPTAKQAAEFYDDLVDEEVKTLVDRIWGTWVQSPFGIGYRKIAGIEKKEREAGEEESPYPEYPDAFLEDGIWKVMRDGKKYRIE